jgi:hypothetical protein
MSGYTPERWVVLEFVTPEETIQKVFAGWYGGYLDGDSWKLNSGNRAERELDDRWEFDGYSGSIYVCHKSAYGLSGYMTSLLSDWSEQAKKEDVTINILDRYESKQ